MRSTNGWKAACLSIGLCSAWSADASAETVPVAPATPLHCDASFYLNVSSGTAFDYDHPVFVYAVHTKNGLTIDPGTGPVSDYAIAVPISLGSQQGTDQHLDFTAPLPDFSSIDPSRYVETFTIIGVNSLNHDENGFLIKTPVFTLDSDNAFTGLLDPSPQPTWKDLQASGALYNDPTMTQQGIVSAFDGSGTLTNAGRLKDWLQHQTTDTSLVHSTFGGVGSIVNFDDEKPFAAQTAALSRSLSLVSLAVAVGPPPPPPMQQNGYAVELGTVTVCGDAVVGLTAAPNPATLATGATSAQVELTATVSGARVAGGAAPTGQADFLEGATHLGSAPLDASGVAVLDVQLGIGSHTIIASYAADASRAPVTSPPVVETVNAPAISDTTTSLTATPANPVFGSQVVLMATVSGAAGATPGGSVKFLDGTTDLAGDVTLSGGTATLSTSALSVGTHSITAVYSGAVGFNPSSSAPASVEVSKAPTTTTLSSSQDPSTFGQSVLLTAKVASDAAGAGSLAGGIVSFLDGSTIIGSGTLDSSGQATLQLSAPPVGNHSIVASYLGAASFAPSQSSALTQEVDRAASTTAVTASNTAPAAGASVNLCATVTGILGAPAPTGSVTFTDGSTTIGSPVALTNGKATAPSGPLTAGTHTITATYSGDGSYASSAASVLVTATRTNTITSITASPATALAGTPVALTASVTSASPGGAPTGSVTFFDGTIVIGGPVSLAAGVATLSNSALTAGPHSITAKYSGDASFNASTSGAASVNVIAATGTTLCSSANPATLGQTFLLTATVAGSSSGGTLQGGVVKFFDGATLLGTGTLDAAGRATLSVGASSLTVGAHALTAVFQGTASFAPSTSNTVTEQVNKAPSSTTLTASSTTPAAGSSVNLTATITGLPGGPAPGGSVTFKDGATVLGTAGVVNGQATLPSGPLSSGAHSITATYGGDATYLSSTGSVTVTVGKAATTTTLCLAPNPALPGQVVTLSVRVTSASGTPAGTVTFTDGAATLGTATLSGGAASLTVSTLAVGSHTIVATYGGSATFAPSLASGVETIQLIATCTTLSVTTCQPIAGQPIALSAAVTAPIGVPGGTVTFLDGATVLGSAALSGGRATLVTSALAAGAHTLTARYGGAPTYAQSVSAPVSLQVGARCPCGCGGDTRASPSCLWPPNHKMVTVTVAGLAGQTCRIIGVTSNEAIDAPGSGNTAPDWTITGALTVSLRAERAGPGYGRVYTISISCVDAHGVTTIHTACVCVPHDQGGGNGSGGGCGCGGDTHSTGCDDGHPGGGCDDGHPGCGDDNHSGGGCGDGHSGSGCGDGHSGSGDDGHPGGGCGDRSTSNPLVGRASGSPRTCIARKAGIT